MAWDDAPPSATELKAGSWDSAPPTKQELGQISSYSDIPQNAVNDIKGIGRGLLGMGKAVVDTAKATPGYLMNTPLKQMGSDAVSAVKSGFNFATDTAPQAISDRIKQLASHPVQSFIDHPVNTAIDVGTVATPLLEGVGGATGAAARAAETSGALDEATTAAARRATGFMKPELRSTVSPFETMRKTAQANMAGREMLDRGAIPFFGSPGTMQENAVKILSEGRAKVGAVVDSLDQAGQTIPTADLGKKIADAVKAKFPDEIKAVNSVINDAEAINPNQINPSSIAELKQRWGKFGFQDKTVGTTVADVYRKAYKAADQILKDHIKDVAPDLLPKYVEGMKDQEVAMTALRGITNKGARMAANNPISLPSAIMAAGDVTSGNLGGAAMKLGATQAVTNRGAAVLANSLKMAKNGLDVVGDLASNATSPSLPPHISALLMAARQHIGLPPQQGGPGDALSPASPQASASDMPTWTPDQQAYRVGLEQFLRNNDQGAKVAWQKALKLNAGNLEARRGLERLSMKKGLGPDAYTSKR